MNSIEETTKAVEKTMLEVAAELHGDSLRVDGGPHPVTDCYGYRYQQYGFPCLVDVSRSSCEAAGVVVTVRLGRLYVGYRRALRWLACNRAGNTVTLSADVSALENRELRVCTHRLTKPDDRDGVRLLFQDVEDEVQRLRICLTAHFPQMVSGARLAAWEHWLEQKNELAWWAVLLEPRLFEEWLRDNPREADDLPPGVICEVMEWLGRWEQHLEWLQRAWESLSDEQRDKETREVHLLQQALALGQLGRPEEVLQRCDELEGLIHPHGRWAWATHRLSALHALGHYEEMLETVRSADYDANPRVWFWRSMAQARLGHLAEAQQSYGRYEEMVGADIIARKQFFGLSAGQDKLEADDPLQNNKEQR